MGDLDFLLHAARAFEPPPAPRWATPGNLARALEPKARQTPALDLIDEALLWAYTKPDARLIISMPTQAGKSQRASRRFPLWALTQNPDLRVAIVSHEAGVARRWGRAIPSAWARYDTPLWIERGDGSRWVPASARRTCNRMCIPVATIAGEAKRPAPASVRVAGRFCVVAGAGLEPATSRL